jgi:hypothetical protein
MEMANNDYEYQEKRLSTERRLCERKERRRTVTPAGPIAPIDEKIVWAKPFVVPSSAGVGEELDMKMNMAPIEDSATSNVAMDKTTH